MEEKRIERLGVCMKTFADVDRQVLPIVGKCLDGMTKAAESIEPKTVSMQTEIYMDTHTHTHTHTTIWDILLTQPGCQSQPTDDRLSFHLSNKCVIGLEVFEGLFENKNRPPVNNKMLLEENNN